MYSRLVPTDRVVEPVVLVVIEALGQHHVREARTRTFDGHFVYVRHACTHDSPHMERHLVHVS